MDAFFLTESLVEPLAIENGDLRSFAVRAITCGLFGFSDSLDTFISRKFVYEQPTDRGDIDSGGICCVSGFWVPGHALVKTARGRAIRKYAPYDKPGRER